MSKPFTKNVYNHPDKLGEGAKKRKKLDKFGKVRAVMGEYKRGTLRSGSGEHVKSKAQATAIAMSEVDIKKKGK